MIDSVTTFIRKHKYELTAMMIAMIVSLQVRDTQYLAKHYNMVQVYIYYSMLICAHLYLIRIRSGCHRLSHITCVALSIYYIVAMACKYLHPGFHHMSYGLFFLLFDYIFLRLFGFAIVIDELINYDELHIFGRDNVVYGIDNIVADHYMLIIVILSFLTILELATIDYYKNRMVADTPLLIELNLSSPLISAQ